MRSSPLPWITPRPRRLRLDLALADDTATGGGTDYGSAGLDNIQVAPDGVTFANGTSITFAAGDTEVSVRTPITVDAVDEADETFDLTATLNTGTTVNADDTGTGTITDDDNAPTLSVDDVEVNEGAGTLTFTVSLSSASSQTVTLDVATADDTATQPGDYTEITATQLTFAAGVTEQMVDVTINNDTIFEISEDFFLDLSNPANATIADNQGVGTITDDGTGTGGTDDDTPTFTVDDVMVDEDTAGFAVFTITLDNASAEAITLDLALADDTATGGGTDYGSAGLDNIQVAPDGVTFANGTSITFTAGDTEVSVRTPITVDAIDEADETFDLTATLNTGTTVNADDTGTGTITDDDNAPTLSVDDVEVNEGAGTLTFTVSLSSASSQTVTVDVATADDTATQPGDYTQITATQLTFAAGVTEQMVDVTINNDTIFEISEDFFLNLTNPS